jgi:putative ubiquitin-RnfH superfamily antitoxin RatB of RatAB toxin-antitoxin module
MVAAELSGESLADSAIQATSESWIELAWIEAGQGFAKVLAYPGPAPVSYRQFLDSDAVSGLLTRLSWPTFAWSVFGQKRAEHERLMPGDRVELLPGLITDPKTARLRRVEHKRRLESQRGWRPQRQR